MQKLIYFLSIFMTISLILTGCQTSEPTNDTDQNSPSTTDTESQSNTTDNSQEQEQETMGNGEYTPADWTKTPLATSDQKITTIQGKNFKVDIYQIAVEKATKRGTFVDRETNQPLIEVGDDLVYLNYIVTNTGKEPLKMGASLVRISPRYHDWKYLQGMDSITDRNIQEKLQLHTTPMNPGTQKPYILQPGTSYAISDNFKYQQGSAIEFKATYTPVDDQGELQNDLREEVSAQATIQ